jgi:hypothetical protein
MGQAQSNNNSSEVDTLNWSDVNTEGMTEGFDVKKNKNGIEIIDIDFNLANSESDTDTINDIFHKLHKVTQQVEQQQVEQPITSESSPFISTEMYNKIMNGGENNSSSPFVNTEAYNKIMKGGHSILDDDSSSSDSDDSTSDSEILRGLSEISVSSDVKYNKKNNNKNKKNKKNKKNMRSINSSTSSALSAMNKKVYGFSNTSSEMIKTSEDNYYINNASTSDTPYKVDSSEINTSDINLVSVDSRNGRRFL